MAKDNSKMAITQGGTPSVIHSAASKFKYPQIHEAMSNMTLPCDDWFFVDVAEDTPVIVSMRSYLSRILDCYHEGYRIISNVVSEDAPRDGECRLWFKVVKR